MREVPTLPPCKLCKAIPHAAWADEDTNSKNPDLIVQCSDEDCVLDQQFTDYEWKTLHGKDTSE